MLHFNLSFCRSLTVYKEIPKYDKSVSVLQG